MFDKIKTYIGQLTDTVKNKIVNSTNFVLEDGATIIVDHIIGNTVSSGLTLNVNNTGAKSVFLNYRIVSSSN